MEIRNNTNIPDLDVEHMAKIFRTSEKILIKKLSNNDRDWARLPNKHQAGVYIPHEYRDGGFFKSLETKPRAKDEGNEIREAYFTTIWPQLGRMEKTTRLVHYTSKGQETHMTGLPKQVFENLLPASYLVMGRNNANGELVYECLTIDSDSDAATFLRDLFHFSSDFHIDEYLPEEIRQTELERVLDFSDQVIKAWLNGSISTFAKESAAMPSTIELARMARAKFLKENNLKNIDPFSLDAPGDVLRKISRNIEWEIFREYQSKERSVELIRITLGDSPRNIDAKFIIKQLLSKFKDIDALMLSASQQRKSRAGYSYEHHIEAALIDGSIPYEKQVIIESKKRPDFILPSLKFLGSGQPDAQTGLILSAKTTLRERWKQVEREMKGRRLYLTTVDENIAGNAIEDMGSIGINLVIPESLLNSKETEYAGHSNVISFKQFCEIHLKPHMQLWMNK